MDVPDFQKLGMETMWPASTWSDAWLEMTEYVAMHHWEEFWKAVVSLAYMNPVRVVLSLIRVMND